LRRLTAAAPRARNCVLSLGLLAIAVHGRLLAAGAHGLSSAHAALTIAATAGCGDGSCWFGHLVVVWGLLVVGEKTGLRE